MCRFTFYRGPPIALSSLITEPTNSLIHQSFHSHEREEPLNGDGFGVAWYADGRPEPALFRSITPAWSNRNLRELAAVVRSSCILAHVRAATQQTDVMETNCHPFKRGVIAFMHNGDIGGFRKLRRPLIDSLSDAAYQGIAGSTDSEHFFAVLQDELGVGRGRAAGDKMEPALEGAIGRILELRARHAPEEHCYLNMVVTDGHSAVACRFTTDDPDNADSLYVNHGRRYVCEDNVCRMVDPEEGGAAVLISSESLSEDPGWTPVPVNSLVVIGPTLSLTSRAMRV